MKIFKNYIFSIETDDDIILDKQALDIVEKAHSLKNEVYNQSYEYIIDVLDKVGKLFMDKNSIYYKTAFENVVSKVKFSKPMIDETFKLVGEILNKKELYKRLSLEVFYPYSLDNPMERYNYDGYIRAYPKGVVLHIGAGNVFLGILDSLVCGMITKNVNIVKVSSSGSNFMSVFAKAVKDVDKKGVIAKSFAILYWQSGKRNIEEAFAKNVNTIMVWGGYDAVDSYRKMAGINTDVLSFGPKTSFGILFEDYIERNGYDDVAKKIAIDCAMWDQSACSNMHDLYVVCKKENREKIVKNLMLSLEKSLKEFSKKFPQGKLSDDEKVEITKIRELAKIDMCFENAQIISSFPNSNYTIIYERDPSYRISPLNRVLYIKTVDDIYQIKKLIKPYYDYLQTVGIGGDIIKRKMILNEFANTGVLRFTELGEMTIGRTGAPHDGRFVLSSLVNWVSLEGRNKTQDKIIELIDFVRKNSFFYKKFYRNNKEIKSINDFKKLPLLEKKHIYENTPPKNYNLFTSRPVRGIYFASGGSTGEPKYVFYEQHEYEHIIKALAYAYEAAGLSEGDIIANLFVSGNLWSSWLSVEKAIAYTKATSVPIGSNLSIEEIVNYLRLFKVNTIIGLPSFLLKVADFVEKNNIKLPIKRIFYGGEYVGDEMVLYFKRVFKNCDVKSGGYATADAGVIGFQCKYLYKGMHHLFTQSQYIEFLDPKTLKEVEPGKIGEVVVTSFNKRKMPLIRYRVGDLGRWILKKCECGRDEPVFEIVGRCDDRIHAGGAHIFVNDIQNAIGKLDELSFNFQVVISKKGTKDQIEIIVEKKDRRKINTDDVIDKLQKSIIENCKDFAESIKMGLIDPPLIKIVEPNTIERIKRTGKIKRVIDKRITL
jgi:phenylacetate-coenzyme A ligase PaaK-like adenylate-forming protein